MFSGQMLLEEEPHSEGKEAEYMYEDAGGGCFFFPVTGRKAGIKMLSIQLIVI